MLRTRNRPRKRSWGGAGGSGATITPAFTLAYSTAFLFAPMFVHYDATATTSSGTSDPFRALNYKMEIVEGIAGNWSYGRQMSKGVCLGAVGGFVLPVAGTYTFKLTVTDGTTTTVAPLQAITIGSEDAGYPTTATICIQVDGDTDFTIADAAFPGNTHYNTPPGDDWDAALGLKAANNKRLLFRGGSTWASAGSDADVSNKTNLTIGNFGTGKAKVTVGSGVEGLYPAGCTNLRFRDIEIDGGSLSNVGVQFQSGGLLNRILLLNLYIHNCGDAIQMTHQSPVMPDVVGIFNCVTDTFTGGASGYTLFTACDRMCVIGNSFDQSSQGFHCFRNGGGSKMNLSNNDFKNASLTGSENVINLKADVFGAGGTYGGLETKNVVISDNVITASTSGEVVEIGALANEDRRVENSVFERNIVTGGTGSGTLVKIRCKTLTARNNLLISSVGNNFAPFLVEQAGGNPAPIPDDVQMYNNSGYSSKTSASAFTFVTITTPCVNIKLRNNVWWTPNLSGTLTMVSDTSITPTIDHNTTAAQSGGASKVQPYVNATPATAAQFAPQLYATTDGVAGLVIDDYNAALRTVGNKGMGAVKP